MLNKKAIAAFAAGATLLSGLAFAAPAFAKDEAKAPKTEQKADNKAAIAALESKIESAKKAKEAAEQEVKDAKKALDKAGLGDLDDKEQAVEKAKKAVEKAKADHAAYKAAEKTKKDAESAFDKYAADVKALFKDSSTVLKTMTQAQVTALAAKDDASEADKAKVNAAKEQLKALVGTIAGAAAKLDALTDGNVSAAESELETAQDTLDEYKNGAYADLVKALNDAKDKVATQQTLLDSYNAQLAALKGEKPAPKPNPNPGPTPVTPGPVTPSVLPNVAQASGALLHTNVAYNEAAAAYGVALNELKDAQAKFDAAEAQLNTLKAQVKAAYDNYHNNFELTHKEDTDAGKAAKADYDNALALAQAYASHEYADAKKTRDEKQAKLDQAGKAINAAKAAYNAAYLTALKVEASAVKGFPDPRNLADAPVDVFSPEGKAAAGKLAAAAAQAGKAGAAAAANGAAAAAGAKAAAGENGGKKKNNAGEDAKKKLGQTGATVALAAVAASVLAGVGAALRKIRH